MYLAERKWRETNRDYALRMIKENIVCLELEPGSMISENDLSSQMGISRTPVREAFIELAEVKIIEVLPQRGSMVSLVDDELVDQAQFMRETLECAMAERCCERGLTSAQIEALEENLWRQDRQTAEAVHERLTRDNQFHQMLFEFAGLAQVHKLMTNMMVHFDRVRAMSLSVSHESPLPQDHREIFAAIAAKDAQRAKTIMHQHLTRYRIDRESIKRQYPQFCR